MTIAPVYIDDIIGEVTQATSDAIQPSGKTLLETIRQNEIDATGKSLIQQIRYSKSSFDELIETLFQADKSGEERFKKYPLVHLIQDIVTERGSDLGFYGTPNLNIVFIHQTQQAFKTQERDDKVFKPVLWPLYVEFMEQLKRSAWIMDTWQVTGEFRHRVIKRAFWGNRQLKSSENILNDYVDAIEIQNLAVKINYSNC
jgi:hypothetical protein